MRRLFFKIFLWFWVAQALTNLVLLGLLTATQNDSGRGRGRNANQAMTVEALGAMSIVQSGGAGAPRALRSFLDRAQRQRGLHAYFFDPAGHELTGHAVTPRLSQLVTRTRGASGPVFDYNGPLQLGAWTAKGDGGGHYVLISELRGVPYYDQSPWLHILPPVQSPRFFALLLTYSVVCFMLARYLAGPVEKLRTATRRLAGGDLSTRVAPEMGWRRDELADLGRDFDLMAERMEAMMQAERRLLADISHELRSPLARLNVALELAGETADAPTASYLQRIDRESGRLNTMLSQLLELTRLEGSASTSSRTPVNLVALVYEVAQDAEFEARASERGVQVVHSEECWTSGYLALLHSAVENLVRNAVRYTADGTNVEIALRSKPVGTSSRLRRAVITVSDRGPGVPEEALPRLFTPFYRVDEARDRQSGGAGLGLAISERAVRLHDGRIRAFNRDGGGLTIEMTLPLDDESGGRMKE